MNWVWRPASGTAAGNSANQIQDRFFLFFIIRHDGYDGIRRVIDNTSQWVEFGEIIVDGRQRQGDHVSAAASGIGEFIIGNRWGWIHAGYPVCIQHDQGSLKAEDTFILRYYGRNPVEGVEEIFAPFCGGDR